MLQQDGFPGTQTRRQVEHVLPLLVNAGESETCGKKREEAVWGKERDGAAALIRGPLWLSQSYMAHQSCSL